MKIVVFNVAAESGGALTVLKEYYNKAFDYKNIEWHFIISSPKLISKDNVYIHRYNWIKKSWAHRLWFDFFKAHKIVKDINPDEVLSLQNLVIPFVTKKQIVYFHQVLPFSEKKFSFFKNQKLWIYQNIIGKLIFYSIRKTDQLIVQANWIKEMLVKDYNVEGNKIIVEAPKFEGVVAKKFETARRNGKIIYFYPAGAEIYKNHQLLINISNRLISEDISNFEMIFTLSGNENSQIVKLKNIVIENNLPIRFVGELSISEVYSMYSKSILIFPSYIETIGLPLLEARMHKTPIVAAELKYAKELLSDYNNVQYFNPFNNDDLYIIIKNNLIENNF